MHAVRPGSTNIFVSPTRISLDCSNKMACMLLVEELLFINELSLLDYKNYRNFFEVNYVYIHKFN